MRVCVCACVESLRTGSRKSLVNTVRSPHVPYTAGVFLDKQSNQQLLKCYTTKVLVCLVIMNLISLNRT
jgi:hypothetical protein